MINLSTFKKIKDEKDHAILESENGHQLRVSKKNLNSKTLKMLNELPHYADGGDVMDDNLTNEDMAVKGFETAGNYLKNAISDKSLPPGQDQIEPSFDLMDFIPPEKAAMMGVAAMKGLAGKMGAAPLVAGAIRRTGTGKLLGTVSEEAAQAGQRAIQQDLLNQARSEGMKDLRGATTAVQGMRKPTLGEAAHVPFLPRSTQAENVDKVKNIYARLNGVLKDSELAKLSELAKKSNVPYVPIENGKLGRMPNYDATPTGIIGNPKNFIKGDADEIFAHDPFMWADQKYGASKELLKKHLKAGKSANITTSSDLIAHDDYMSAIPKGSTVNLVLAEPTKENRTVLPSKLRLLNAYERLKENGINVNLVKPDSKSKSLVPINPFEIKTLKDTRGQGYAEGGEVDQLDQIYQPEQQNIYQEPDRSIASVDQPLVLNPNQSPEMQNNMMVENRIPSSEQLPIAQQPQAPVNFPLQQQQQQPNYMEEYNRNLLGGMQKGFNEQAAGIQQQAKAEQEIARRQAQAAEEYNKMLSEYNERKTESFNKVYTDIAAAAKDVQNNQIDPHRYMNSKSALGKVSTTIGLILGGIGSALTGQPNAGLELLNRNIDRDMDAQRAELGKKQNILDAYYKQLGNMREADAMTRAFYMDIYKNKIEQAAMLSGDKAAMARAQQLIGQMDVQKAQLLGPIANRAAVFGAQNVSPELKIKMAAPEKDQPELFKKLTEMRKAEAFRQNLQKDLNRLNELTTLKSNVSLKGITGQTVSEANALKEKMGTELMRFLAESSSQTEFEAMKHLLPKTSDSAETASQKIQSLMKAVDAKMQYPELSLYGIRPNTAKVTPR